METDHSKMKLGKLNPVHDSDTPQLANYLNLHTLPAAPEQYSYTGDISTWGMMDNDKIGNCTCAAAGHLIMEWTASNGKMVTPTDADIINAYAAITGYNPATGANDGGAGVKEALNYWRKNGIAGHRIMGYAALEPQNHQHVMQSVYLFGMLCGVVITNNGKNAAGMGCTGYRHTGRWRKRIVGWPCGTRGRLRCQWLNHCNMGSYQNHDLEFLERLLRRIVCYY